MTPTFFWLSYAFKGAGEKQWKQCVNEVPVIRFNSGKYNLNMISNLWRRLVFNKVHDCNEDVFVAKKKQSDYMFLITPQFEFFGIKYNIGPKRLGASQ